MYTTKKIEEFVCADALAYWLKHHCGCQDVKIDKEEHDSPDFWITVNGEKFAAEVTSIVTDHTYHMRCRHLKDAIRRVACQGGDFSGTYVLSFWHRPEIPKRHSSQWRDIRDRATSFIQTTRADSSTKEYLLLQDDHGRLAIKKRSAHGADVGLVGVKEVKWEGEITDELSQIMRDRIKEKRRTLEKKGVPAICPKIMLLLYDAYGYADPDAARKALSKVEGYDWFHSIFWAASFTDRPNQLSPENPGRNGTFLYTKNQNWKRAQEGCRTDNE